MSWEGIAVNQTISNENLQDAINQGIFTAGPTPIPLTSPNNKKQGTKERVLTYVNIPNPNYAPWLGRLNNQLIIKDDIYAEGEFILDPQYGKIFTSLSGTSLPVFTFNVTSVTTKFYNYVIPAQTITIGVSGNAFVTPPKISLFIDSLSIESKQLLNNGAQTVTLTIPYDIYAPSQVRISISTGVVPPVPPLEPLDFDSIPVNTVAVSRTTGQYQILGSGIQEEGFKYQTGFLYVSSDYGQIWTQKTTPGQGYWSKVANSDNGQYALAVDINNCVYKSSDYGNTWTKITNYPNPNPGVVTIPSQQNFQSCALSGNGQVQVITINSTIFPNVDPLSPFKRSYGLMYISYDYGSTWVVRSVDGTIFRDYNSVDISASGGVIVVEVRITGTLTSMYRSFDSGSSWALSFNTSNNPSFKQISMTADGGEVVAASYSSPYGLVGSVGNAIFLRATKDLNSFFNWYNIGPNLIWHGADIYDFSGATNGYAVVRSVGALYSQLTYIKNITNNLTSTTDNTASPLKKYRCISCSNDGQYALAGANPGLYRTTDRGVTWLKPPLSPIITTEGTTNISNTTATFNGNLVSNQGYTVTAKGFQYFTSFPIPGGAPIISSNNAPATLGAYTGNVTGLSPGTTYYVKAYATNAIGTTYGDTLTFQTTGANTTTTTTTAAPTRTVRLYGARLGTLGSSYLFYNINGGTILGGYTLTTTGTLYATFTVNNGDIVRVFTSPEVSNPTTFHQKCAQVATNTYCSALSCTVSAFTITTNTDISVRSSPASTICP
jgi:photosystem II stability/assembly factor-like uncharacterized protein